MLDKIRIVEVDHFYESVRQPLARHYFGEMVLLRAEGYGPDFPKNYLPLDTSDFVCLYYLFCLKEGEEEVVIGGFKHMSLKRCDQYNIMPPFLTAIHSSHSPIHIEAFEHLLERHRQNNQDLLYGGGFTIKKKYRENRELSAFLKELLVALVLFDQNTRPIETIITGANMRFKTEKLFQQAGYEPLKYRDQALGPFAKNTAFGDQILLMQLIRPSVWAEECYQKHKHLIDSREIIADGRLCT